MGSAIFFRFARFSESEAKKCGREVGRIWVDRVDRVDNWQNDRGKLRLAQQTAGELRDKCVYGGVSQGVVIVIVLHSMQ